MTDIHPVHYPLPIGFGMRGGPHRYTEIHTALSGAEHRSTPNEHSRRRYDVGAGIKSSDDLATLINFFEARRGQLYGFLFRDPLDHKSCAPSATPSGDDQIIGQGDGARTRFALRKTYADDHGAWTRRISYARPDSVLVHIDGQAAEFFHDESAGEIVFDVAPGQGAQIAAGFVFDVPVRFDAPGLELAIETFGAGQMGSISLIEVITHEP